MTLLERLIPKKYGEKEHFRADEVMEILHISDIRTLRAKDCELNPIQTSTRIWVYTRESLEVYISKQNNHTIRRSK